MPLHVILNTWLQTEFISIYLVIVKLKLIFGHLIKAEIKSNVSKYIMLSMRMTFYPSMQYA